MFATVGVIALIWIALLILSLFLDGLEKLDPTAKRRD